MELNKKDFLLRTTTETRGVLRGPHGHQKKRIKTFHSLVFFATSLESGFHWSILLLLFVAKLCPIVIIKPVTVVSSKKANIIYQKNVKKNIFQIMLGVSQMLVVKEKNADLEFF